jgi:hypothetical protein
MVRDETYPSRNRSESTRPTTLISTNFDIVHGFGISIENRVQESHRPLASLDPLLVDQCDQRGYHGRGHRCAVTLIELTFDGANIAYSISGNIGVAAGVLCVVVLTRAVVGTVVTEKVFQGCGLV